MVQIGSRFHPFVSAATNSHGEMRRLGLRVWSSRWGLGSLAYSATRRYRVAAGAPHCPGGRLEDLFQEFEDDCLQRRKKAVYFGLPSAMLDAFGPFRNRGRVHIGDAPVFNANRWIHRNLFPAGIATQIRRAEAHGVSVRHLAEPPDDTRGLRRCLESWLAQKGLPPIRFMTNPFVLDPWPQYGVWVAEQRGVVCGLLALSRAVPGEMWRIDLIARIPEAPNGCSELLVAGAFEAIARKGAVAVTLGLAPLSIRSGPGGRANPVWFRVISDFSRRWGSFLYSLDGLEAFKAKFRPDRWQPLFCISPGRTFTLPDGMALMRVFTHVPLAKYGWEALRWRLSSPEARRALVQRAERS